MDAGERDVLIFSNPEVFLSAMSIAFGYMFYPQVLWVIQTAHGMALRDSNYYSENSSDRAGRVFVFDWIRMHFLFDDNFVYFSLVRIFYGDFNGFIG